MKNRFIIFVTSICLLVMPALAWSTMSSDHFQVKTSVMSGAGGPMNSASYSSNSVLGQPTPIMLQDNHPWSASFTLYPGYIYTIPPSSCFGDLDVDGDVDGSDLYIFLLGYPGSFDAGDLIRFTLEFGKTDCL